MKRLAITVLCAGAAAAAALGFAGTANAAGGADATVQSLTAEGYVVQLVSSPTANLSACTITDVQKDPLSAANATAYVDIACPDGC